MNITTNYTWERNGNEIADDDLNFEKDGKYLIFKHLDQQKHNGSYKCSVRLTNSQIVLSKEFKMEIFKSMHSFAIKIQNKIISIFFVK